MNLQEIENEIEQLSIEERAKLRRHLEFFGDPDIMEELTRNNRVAAAGRVVSREEVLARLKAAGKYVE